MHLKGLLEEFERYETKPSEKMLELGNKIKRVFSNAKLDERPCLKIDFENKEDYPVVSVYNDKVETHIYPKDFDLNGEMELQITSGKVDNIYKEADFDKFIEDLNGELNVHLS